MKQCLIVDDSEVIRKIASKIASDMGFAVSEAENGHEALEQCRYTQPEVILLDWHMPVMSAYEFLDGLRKSAPKEWPHIVYCTTENDSLDFTRAIKAGCSEVLMKPFDGESLQAKLGQVTQPAA